jgi:LysM repeat protein
VEGLYGAIDIDVSPDGNNVYVTSLKDDAVVIFNRNNIDGTLTFVRAIEDGSVDPYSSNSVDGLNGAISLALSSDGERAYVVSREDNALTSFSRVPGSGDLTLSQTLFDGGSDGSGHTIDGLGGAQQVAVNSDGSYVFVAARSDNALTSFNRADSGLVFDEVLFDNLPDASGSTVEGLGAALAVSADGKYIYTLGYTDNAITVFSRESPNVGVNPSTLQFGSVLVGEVSNPKTITITNTGLLNLNISDIAVTGDYTHTHSCPAQLSPSDSCEIQVVFSPTKSGSRSGLLSLGTDAPDSPTTVPLAGTGATSVEPPPADNTDVTLTGAAFPATASVGDTISWTFAISNIGSGATLGLVFHAPTGSRLNNLGGTASQGVVDVYPNEMAWDVGSIPDKGTASVSLETRLLSMDPSGSEDPSRVCILGTVASVGKLLCVTLIDRPIPDPTLTPTATVFAPTLTPDLTAETYVVQAGDTLTSIAFRYGLTVSELVRLNSLADASTIFTGQLLRLRETSTPTATLSTILRPTSTRVPTTGSTGEQAAPVLTNTASVTPQLEIAQTSADPDILDSSVNNPAATPIEALALKGAAAALVLAGSLLLAAIGVFLVRIWQERREEEL